MKVTCLVLLCSLALTSGELLAALKFIHDSHVLEVLDPSDQVKL